jgi:FlaA1/EpsC-like NDP-sugar epimerase
MNKLVNIDAVIAATTRRTDSFFNKDIESNKDKLVTEIEGKNILVIGGAGTIGSNYIKAILRQAKPQKLIVVDINENGLTELVRDIRSSVDLFVPDQLLTYPIDFSSKVFEKIFFSEKPFNVIANFAAHKHVRSEKDIFSIEAMVENNVIKAFKLLKMISNDPPQHFFCVSTDKAANPVNIMGASKKLMEDVIMAFSDKISITTARFANVAFSNGSLPYGFIERLMKQQPFSAPEDVRRFFVSPTESGELCMIACLLGKSGDIFFPKLDAEKDMNTFAFIAEELLKNLGLKPKYFSSEQEARDFSNKLNSDSSEYPVFFFKSDTSGEKPYEEFYTEDEKLDMGTFNNLGIIKDTYKPSIKKVKKQVTEIKHLFKSKSISKTDIVDWFKKALPHFDHIETGKNLDQKM